jgi:hypothetical protein
MKTRLTALGVVLLSACGGSPDDSWPEDTERDELGLLAAAVPQATIYNIEANDQFAVDTTLGDVFYARTVPKLAGQSFGWWARFDIAIHNTGSTTLSVTGLRVDTDVSAPTDHPLAEAKKIEPGGKERIKIPGAIEGVGHGPTTLKVDALIAGYNTPVSRTVDFKPFDAETASGGFRFPARSGDLEPGEYWLADDHKHGVDQTYAYDFNVTRWTGDGWSNLREGGSSDNPEDHLIWEKPLYAVADGHIVRCSRSIEDDIDGDGGGGNTIILNVGDGKYISYWHMRQWSVSKEHCPFEGFGGVNGDDPAPLHIFVKAGTKLGEVGHSGASSAPHLHMQLSDTLPSGPSASNLRSLPLNFFDIDTHEQGDDDASDATTWTRIHADLPAALHTYNIVKPNACGWLSYDGSASEVTHHAISAACYEDVLTNVVEQGFRLVHVDGYDVAGATFYNVVLRPDDGSVGWGARHAMTAAEYQTEVTNMKAAGYQLLQADSYLTAGSVRYAAIFQTGLPPRAAYHSKTTVEHQDKFNEWKALGYHPVSVSVVSVAGAREYTAVWEKSAFPSWVLSSTIASSDLTATISAHNAAGRHVWSLQAYRHNGALYFAALFGASGPGTSVSPQNSSDQHQTAMEFYRASGFDTRAVTGFESAGQARFVGVWTN